MNQSEWQQRLDTEFPNGADATKVHDVPEGDDNDQLLLPRLVVDHINDQDLPVLYSYPMNIGSDKDTIIEIGSVEQDEPGFLDITAVNGVQWILRPLTAPGAVEKVNRLRIIDPELFKGQNEAE